MKKNKQMKPDNVAKRLWAFFIVLTMCITVQPVVPVKAQEAVQTAARTIYTEFKDGNSTHSGDGSYGNPYNLFEDAYAAAGNGAGRCHGCSPHGRHQTGLYQSYPSGMGQRTGTSQATGYHR